MVSYYQSSLKFGLVSELLLFGQALTHLGDSPLLEHLVELLDVDVDEVGVGDDPVGLRVRLELVFKAMGGHIFVGFNI